MIKLGSTYMFVKSGAIVKILSKNRDDYEGQSTFTVVKANGKKLLVTERGLIDLSKLRSY